MKHRYPTLAFAITTLAAQAQITVTTSVFPVVGDTLHYVFGNMPDAINAVFTPPGGDQVWDLSGLQADSTWDAIYRDPATGVGFAEFPGAALMLTPAGAPAGQEDYLSVTATAVSRLGSYGADPLALGHSLTLEEFQPVPLNRAPLNFFDIYSASSGYLVAFDAADMPPSWNDALPSPDSARLREATTEIVAVNAYGTLTIPGGSYPVLRETWTRYRERRIDAFIQPLGWLDVTDVSIAQGGLDPELFGVDTTYSFHFINDVSKETIAIVTYVEDYSGSNPTYVSGVQYKVAADISTAAVGAATADTRVRVFPNPATDRIRIQAPILKAGSYVLRLTDATGREVLHRRYAPGASGMPLELEISELASGPYQGMLIPGKGDPLVFRFVKR